MPRLSGYGLKLLSPFFMHLQSGLDMRLVDEAPPGAPKEVTKRGKPDWKGILIILVLIFMCVIAILTLLGPTTCNGIHSNVIMNL